jgi:hypothetical protein
VGVEDGVDDAVGVGVDEGVDETVGVAVGVGVSSMKIKMPLIGNIVGGSGSSIVQVSG